MKQFIYKSEVVGLSEWPSGTLRLEGVEQTDRHDEADVFVIPGFLTGLFPNRSELCNRLPYFTKYEAKHVGFDCSDNEPLYDTSARFIRCNTRDWYLSRDPNTISWPWPVENYIDCASVPSGGFEYDVSFHGWIRSHDTRQKSFELMSSSQLKCDLAGYPDFTGYIWDTPEGLRRRREFRRSLHASRLILCPESISGVFPYRFWEALSAARIPILIGSEFVFPFKSKIDYSSFCIRVERKDIHDLNDIVIEFLSTHDDEAIAAMGKLGRMYWERWLDSAQWPRLHGLAVREAL